MTEPATSTYYILGSCVTRDAFERPGAPTICGYTARTSLASAFDRMPASVPGFDLEGNPSAFQRRMVQTDVEKRLAGILEESSYDRLLVDFIDERFNLLRLDGAVITHSPESMACLPKPDRDDLVTPGSDEHLAGFSRGLERLVTLVDPDRIVLNRVYWGSLDNLGRALPDQANIERNNELLAHLYELAAAAGIGTTLDYGTADFLVDAGHRWGIGPYHYTAAFYDRTLEQLASLDAATATTASGGDE